MKKARIEQFKKKYKNQWLLVKVLEEDELNRPTEGLLLSRSKNREDIYNALVKVKAKEHVATFYTGRIPKKGYAVAF